MCVPPLLHTLKGYGEDLSRRPIFLERKFAVPRAIYLLYTHVYRPVGVNEHMANESINALLKLKLNFQKLNVLV